MINKQPIWLISSGDAEYGGPGDPTAFANTEEEAVEYLSTRGYNMYSDGMDYYRRGGGTFDFMCITEVDYV